MGPKRGNKACVHMACGLAVSSDILLVPQQISILVVFLGNDKLLVAYDFRCFVFWRELSHQTRLAQLILNLLAIIYFTQRRQLRLIPLLGRIPHRRERHLIVTATTLAMYLWQRRVILLFGSYILHLIHNLTISLRFICQQGL